MRRGGKSNAKENPREGEKKKEELMKKGSEEKTWREQKIEKGCPVDEKNQYFQRKKMVV